MCRQATPDAGVRVDFRLRRPVLPARAGLVVALALGAGGLGLAPLRSHAQTTVEPSKTSAMLDDLRTHAGAAEPERRRAPGLRQDDFLEPSDEIGLNPTAARAREEAYRGAYGAGAVDSAAAGRREIGFPTATSIYDEIYDRDRAYRETAGAPVRTLGGSMKSQGRIPGGEVFAVPYRTSYFPGRRTTYRGADRDPNANARLGSIDTRIGLSTFVEYNDNILRSNDDQLEDFIVGAFMNLSNSWQVTPNNRLDLQLGIGIEHFLDHQDEVSSTHDDFNLIVSPDSLLSWDMFVGDLLVNLHQRFSVEDTGRDRFQLDAVDIFSKWTSESGISLYYPLNSQFDISAGYDYFVERALDEAYEFTDRDSHEYYAAVSYSPTGFWRTGVQFGGAFTDYQENIQNDATSYHLGVFYETPITKNTSVRLEGGYQWISFDSGGLNQDNSDQNGFYGSLALTNDLNKYFSHSLTIGRQASLGVTTNYTTYNYARYGATVKFRDRSSITLGTYYEMEDDSGGAAEEDLDRYGVSLAYQRILTRRLHLSLGGLYSTIDSDVDLRGYDQWSAFARLNYSISDKLGVGLSYQYWQADADDPSQDFDQNRVILNLYYNF